MSDIPTPAAANCNDEHDPQALTVEQAQQRIEAALTPLSGIERIPVRDCLDRVLADDVIAAFDIPGAANSAMDGYALRADDLAAGRANTLRLVGEAYAGKPWTGEINAGECVRIMTGALLPRGADTVVMQEETTRDGNLIQIARLHPPHSNVRQAGEDVRRGAVALVRGKSLNAADIGLLASTGMAEVDVRRKPTVAFFSTGDELESVGQVLAPGQLYDSNRYTLHALLQRTGVRAVDLGVVRDDLESVRSALRQASECADLIISSGGVSVGDADYVKQALADLGEMDFWKIAVKPGRPLAFGKISGVPIFGLPGNPVSVMTTFVLFVRLAIDRLGGAQPRPLLKLKALCMSALRKTRGRTDFQRGIMRIDAQGELIVETTGLQGSHVLTSMSLANCFIVLPRDGGNVPIGSTVDVIPFETIL